MGRPGPGGPGGGRRHHDGPSRGWWNGALVVGATLGVLDIATRALAEPPPPPVVTTPAMTQPTVIVTQPAQTQPTVIYTQPVQQTQPTVIYTQPVEQTQPAVIYMPVQTTPGTVIYR